MDSKNTDSNLLPENIRLLEKELNLRERDLVERTGHAEKGKS